MSERKNIDRLFQEKFKDFEVAPSEDTWANIEARLDEKKKRRIIPFWWKLSGVAAIFIFGFLISKSINNGEIKTENPIVNENQSIKKELKETKELNKKNIGITVENAVVNKVSSQKSNSETADKKDLKNNKSIIANATGNPIKSNFFDKKNRKTTDIYSSKSAIAETKSINRHSLKNKSNQEKVSTAIVQSVNEKSQNQIVQTDSKEKTYKETYIKSDNAPINLDDLKGNINSKIATKEIEKK